MLGNQIDIAFCSFGKSDGITFQSINCQFILLLVFFGNFIYICFLFYYSDIRLTVPVTS